MEVYRYRADGEEPAQVPTHEQIAEFAIFAVGYQDKDAIKVKLEGKYPKGEKFRVSWDKAFEIDGSCLATHASQSITDPLSILRLCVSVYHGYQRSRESQSSGQETLAR